MPGSSRLGPSVVLLVPFMEAAIINALCSEPQPTPILTVVSTVTKQVPYWDDIAFDWALVSLIEHGRCVMRIDRDAIFLCEGEDG